MGKLGIITITINFFKLAALVVFDRRNRLNDDLFEHTLIAKLDSDLME